MLPAQIHQLHTSRGLIAPLFATPGGEAALLANYGITASDYATPTEERDLLQAYLTRVTISPSFDPEFIIGALLPASALHGRLLDMAPPEYLWERKGIVTLVRLDEALLPPNQGVRLAAPAADLDEQLADALRLGAVGVSLRSIIDEADPVGITNVVAQQFTVAHRIATAGLVPLCQPVMRVGSDERAHAEQLLAQSLLAFLDGWDADLQPMLGLSLPATSGCYADVIAHDRVLRVLACSDEESRQDAVAQLAANPGMVACFGRALVEDLNVSQDDAQFDEALAASVAAIWAASPEGPHDREP